MVVETLTIRVFYREREKAEQRDRKVLEILQQKDERIDELQTNLAYNTRELGESAIRYDPLETRLSLEMLRLFFCCPFKLRKYTNFIRCEV